MIPKSKLQELRNHLDKAENPLFFFDDDVDGLSSFLLFKKYCNKGKGVVVKAQPSLDENYLRKVTENSPDYIFVLDLAIISQEFIDSVDVPIMWLDHHPPLKRKKVNHFNPLLHKPYDNRPTSYYAYKTTQQDLWIAVIGTIADWYIPEFTKEFNKKYPNILPKQLKDPARALYSPTSRIKQLVRLFSFLLKGKTSEVNRSIHILSKIDSPYELLNQETPRAKYLFKKIKKLKEEYERILNKCLNKKTRERVLLIKYPKTKTSFIGELSSELSYLYPNKVIIVAGESLHGMRISLRSRKYPVSDSLQKALEGLNGYGGGHKFACGAYVSKDHFNIFVERFKSLINKI
jgi:single-stranded DNA-specific DHH superfamily exonuclease